METARMSYTSAVDLMGLTVGELLDARAGLFEVLRREQEAREAARG